VSTGTKAVFLSPTDALHGDIGIVGGADLLVAFSKSGGSEELLKLLPFAKVLACLCTLASCSTLGCMLHGALHVSNNQSGPLCPTGCHGRCNLLRAWLIGDP
jgi:D-arabinose 5-phosphate isomerase GutQ